MSIRIIGGKERSQMGVKKMSRVTYIFKFIYNIVNRPNQLIIKNGSILTFNDLGFKMY